MKLFIGVILLLSSSLCVVYPRRVDEAVETLLGILGVSPDPTKWARVEKDRIFIERLLIIGFILVLLLPFDYLWLPGQLAGYPDWPWPHPENAYHPWEIAVCFWTLLFLDWFVVRENYKLTAGLELCGTQAYLFGIIVAILYIAFSIGLFTVFIKTDKPFYYLLAEVGISILLCASDLIFAFWCRRKNKPRLAQSYQRFLAVVDLPSFCAFIVVLAFFLYSVHNDACVKAFVSGAAALNLILANAAFAALYVIDVYEGDIPPSPNVASKGPRGSSSPDETVHPALGNPPSPSAAGKGIRDAMSRDAELPHSVLEVA